MTDNKSKDDTQPSAAAKATDAGSTGKEAVQDKRASPNTDGKKQEKKNTKRWVWLLLIVIAIGALATWSWLNREQLQDKLAGFLSFQPAGHSPGSRTDTSEAPTAPSADDAGQQPPGQPVRPEAQPPQQSQPDSSPSTGTPTPDAQRQTIAALRDRVQQQSRDIAQLQQQLAALQRQLTAQGNRLSELGNVNRSDWQLAEADYLLRLANQRLLLERDSRAALGLLEEVDKILHRLDQPDLYGVRRQIADDITALKLVEDIDREGLYARLRALEDQLVKVNIQPEFDLATRDAAETQSEGDEENASPLHRSWNHFKQFMRDSVRIRDGDIDPVLLSPQSEARFRQSLRLNMEQAELALLRGNADVYRDALNRNRKLLLDYAAPGKQRDALAQELRQLAQENIEPDLPSLAASQRALRDYIDRLHKTSNPDADATGGERP